MAADDPTPDDLPVPPRHSRRSAEGAIAGAAAGAAAGTAAVAGSMGIRGYFGSVGNATAMVCLTVMMFLLYKDFTASTRAELEYQRTEMRRVADRAMEESDRNRRAYTEQHANIFNAIHDLEKDMKALVGQLRKAELIPKPQP